METKVIFSFLLIMTLGLTSAFNFEGTLVSIGNPLESNGAIPVNIQDQVTDPLDLFFVQLNGSVTTLAADAVIDDITINVTNVTGNIVPGTYLGLSGSNKFYFGEVLSVSGNLVTLDTPLDQNYTTGEAVIPTTRDLAVDGSTTTQTFFVGTGGPNSEFVFDITRIMIHMETSGTPDLSTFGDLTALTNGIVLRKTDGVNKNIFNVKSNGEMRNLCYDMQVDSASNPAQGQNGVGFRYTFAGQDKHGVAVRLEPGDELQLIIQDDLSGITQFRVIAEGHVVQD